MDIALIQQADGTFDLALDGPDLATDDGLHTAAILSLFGDARAHADDDIPDGTADRRGYWADTYAEIAGDVWGSRQWLLGREKQIPATLARAREYAEEALRWLVDDGVARSVSATASVLRPGVLALEITIARANDAVARYRFETFWGNQ